MENKKRLNEKELRVWRAFLNAHAAVINHIEDELEEAKNVPLSSYDVLVALSESEGHRLRMHELAEKVVLSRSGLTRLVDRLEKEGLLTRERTSTDRRGAYAVLTPQGFEALRKAWPIYARGINQYFASQLTSEEIDSLTGALERVNRNARNKVEGLGD